jgi:hypothetical protein
VVTLGKNVKLTVGRSLQGQLRAVFEVFGAELVTPMPTLDAFRMGGASIGFAYVDDAEALTAEQMRKAPWLEFLVDDVDRTNAQLDALGLARLDYHDKAHAYFAGPGGFVFRIAKG